jgi:hypothetical protein
MRLSFVPTPPRTTLYSESFWVFESAVGMPLKDTSMAASNDCPQAHYSQRDLVGFSSGWSQPNIRWDLPIYQPSSPDRYREVHLQAGSIGRAEARPQITR